MSTSPSDFNAQTIEEFRANEGHVGGMFEGTTLLLPHHIGAKTGTRRINPWPTTAKETATSSSLPAPRR